MRIVIASLSTAVLFAQGVSREKLQLPKPKIEIIKIATPKDLIHENKLLSIFGVAPFLSEDLPKDLIERYRIIWSRAFHPPMYFYFNIHRSSRITAGSARMDKIPSTGPIGRIDSTWVDLSVQHSDEKSYCSDFINVLRTQADTVFWAAPFRENDTNTIGVDGSTWTIEGQNCKNTHIISRWSPSERSEIFQFLVLIINATGARLYYDEVY